MDKHYSLPVGFLALRMTVYLPILTLSVWCLVVVEWHVNVARSRSVSNNSRRRSSQSVWLISSHGATIPARRDLLYLRRFLHILHDQRPPDLTRRVLWCVHILVAAFVLVIVILGIFYVFRQY